MNKILKYIKISPIVALAIVLSFSAYAQMPPAPGENSGQTATPLGQFSFTSGGVTQTKNVKKADAKKCGAAGSGGKISPDCPNANVRRTDISPKCIEEQNNVAGNCLNTMPVTGVSRIPEDVCFRNEGWGKKRNHNGFDYAAGLNTVVTASADGEVKGAIGNQRCPGGSWNMVKVLHIGCGGKKYYTVYGHLNKVASGIHVGSKVKKGDILGYVGDTGSCGSVHLHYELKDANESPLNPLCNSIQALCDCNAVEIEYETCRSGKAEASSPSMDTPYGVAVNDHIVKEKSECNFAEIKNSHREWGCVFCKPFQLMFNTASKIAKIAFDGLASSVVDVVLVAFAIWIAFTIMRFVSTMEIREPRILVKTLLEQAFRVLVVVVLLKMPLLPTFNMTIDPVFTTGLKIAQVAGNIEGGCTIEQADDGTLVDLKILPQDEGGLSEEMGKSILCAVKSAQDQVIDIMALGSFSLCISWEEGGWLIPHLGYLFTFVALYVGGFLLLCIYPFLLVDSILKLSIAVALFPAALGAFAFKITSKYLAKVWETFLSAIFSFIFLSLVLFILSMLTANEVSKIVTTEETNILSGIMWWTGECLRIVFVCFLGWAVLGEAKEFAGKFASGISLSQDIGATTGSSAGEAVKKSTNKPRQAIGRYAKKAGGQAFKAVWRGGKEMAHQGIMNARASSYKSSAASKSASSAGSAGVAGTANNKVTMDKTNFLHRLISRKKEVTFSEDANGNMLITSVTTTKNGDTITRSTDRFAEVKTKRVNGNIVSRTSTPKASGLKYLTYRDGSTNQRVISNFMQNSMLSEDEKYDLLAREVVRERMSSEYAAALGKRSLTRNVTHSTDENGNKVVSVSNFSKNGEVVSVNMTITPNFGQIKSEYEVVSANGRSAQSFASDGIVQRKSTIQIRRDNNGNNIKTTHDKWAFSQYYADKLTTPLSANGRFDEKIPQDKIMFSQGEMQNFAAQVKDKGNKHYKFKDFV